MRKFVESFVKNAYLYDTQEEYIIAAEKKANGPLTEYELEYLLKNATTKVGAKGAEYLWNDKVKRVIGTFSVCDPCLALLGKSNDVVKVVVARVGIGECEVCGKGGRVLRKANVDNYGKVARTTVVKSAAVMDNGIIVKIIDVPSRLSALIGSLARIKGVEITHSQGVRYELELENGLRVPYKFKAYQIEEVPDSNSIPKDVVEDTKSVNDAVEDVTSTLGSERGDNESIAAYYKRINGLTSSIVDDLVKEAMYEEDEEGDEEYNKLWEPLGGDKDRFITKKDRMWEPIRGYKDKEASNTEDDEDRFGIKDEEDGKDCSKSARLSLRATTIEGYEDAQKNIEQADPRTMLETGDLPEMSVDRDFREQI